MKKMMRRVLLPLICLVAFQADAANLKAGQRVPAVGVASEGELLLSHGELRWQPWNSARLPGRVRVVMHLAGRLAAKEQSAAFSEALKAARLPADRYQTTLIIDTDDAIPGSGMFVRASLKESKRDSPQTQIISDGLGAVRSAWQLARGGATVVVLDRNGLVRFVGEGALSPAEIADVMTLLRQLIATEAVPR